MSPLAGTDSFETHYIMIVEVSESYTPASESNLKYGGEWRTRDALFPLLCHQARGRLSLSLGD
jgi:hypothetical protein